MVAPAINSYAGCASSICFSEISEPWPRFHGNAERSDEGSLQRAGAGALSLPSPAAVLALHTRSCSCATIGVLWELPGVCAGQVCAQQVPFVPAAPGERTEAAPGWEGSRPQPGPHPLHPSEAHPPVSPAPRSCASEPSDAVIAARARGTRGSVTPKWPRWNKSCVPQSQSPGCPALRESRECRCCQLLTEHQPPRDLPVG